MCDRVVILHHGRSIAAGPLDEVVAIDGVRLRVTGLADAGRTIAAAFGPAAVDGDWLAVRPLAAERIPDLVAALVAGGGRVHAVEPGRGSLEAAFLELARRPGRRRTVIAIAQLTVRELVRRRVVWVLRGADRRLDRARRAGASIASSSSPASAAPTSSRSRSACRRCSSSSPSCSASSWP